MNHLKENAHVQQLIDYWIDVLVDWLVGGLVACVTDLQKRTILRGEANCSQQLLKLRALAQYAAVKARSRHGQHALRRNAKSASLPEHTVLVMPLLWCAKLTLLYDYILPRLHTPKEKRIIIRPECSKFKSNCAESSFSRQAPAYDTHAQAQVQCTQHMQQKYQAQQA